jgi:hypothetical protein
MRMLTVRLSIALQGMSALPRIKVYARKMAAPSTHVPEPPCASIGAA